MDVQLAGTRALVTGGSRGIGKVAVSAMRGPSRRGWCNEVGAESST